jgi:hypothetical protein
MLYHVAVPTVPPLSRPSLLLFFYAFHITFPSSWRFLYLSFSIHSALLLKKVTLIPMVFNPQSSIKNLQFLYSFLVRFFSRNEYPTVHGPLSPIYNPKSTIKNRSSAVYRPLSPTPLSPSLLSLSRGIRFFFDTRNKYSTVHRPPSSSTLYALRFFPFPSCPFVSACPAVSSRVVVEVLPSSIRNQQSTI